MIAVLIGAAVALIVAATLLAGAAEWLTGARACPNRSVVGPSSASERVGPSADPGEEMALSVSGKVSGLHVRDASFIHVSIGNLPCRNQLPQPCGGERIDLVVVGPARHAAVSIFRNASSQRRAILIAPRISAAC